MPSTVLFVCTPNLPWSQDIPDRLIEICSRLDCAQVTVKHPDSKPVENIYHLSDNETLSGILTRCPHCGEEFYDPVAAVQNEPHGVH